MSVTSTYQIPIIAVASFFLLLAISSCKEKQGCTDKQALNYNAEAKTDDGSCEYKANLRFVGTYVLACTTSFNSASGSNSSTSVAEIITICESETSDAEILIDGAIRGMATVNGDSFKIQNQSGVNYISNGGQGYIKGDSLFIKEFFSGPSNYSSTICSGIKTKTTCE